MWALLAAHTQEKQHFQQHGSSAIQGYKVQIVFEESEKDIKKYACFFNQRLVSNMSRKEISEANKVKKMDANCCQNMLIKRQNTKTTWEEVENYIKFLIMVKKGNPFNPDVIFSLLDYFDCLNIVTDMRLTPVQGCNTIVLKKED